MPPVTPAGRGPEGTAAQHVCDGGTGWASNLEQAPFGSNRGQGEEKVEGEVFQEKVEEKVEEDANPARSSTGEEKVEEKVGNALESLTPTDCLGQWKRHQSESLLQFSAVSRRRLSTGSSAQPDADTLPHDFELEQGDAENIMTTQDCLQHEPSQVFGPHGHGTSADSPQQLDSDSSSSMPSLFQAGPAWQCKVRQVGIPKNLGCLKGS